jgi:uncharacterized membrane protein
VPENKLKFAVGVLITSFGGFWVGEGLGFHWPGQDLSILGFVGGFLLLSLIIVPAVRQRAPMNFAAPGGSVPDADSPKSNRVSSFNR